MKNKDITAIIWNDRCFTFQWLLEKVKIWEKKLVSLQIVSGTPVIIEANFCPHAVALLLAFIKKGILIIPITEPSEKKRAEVFSISRAKFFCRVDENQEVTFKELQDIPEKYGIYSELQEKNHPGLILFSSGSSGKMKAAVHDMLTFLSRFHQPRSRYRAISFLRFDHIGGLSTLFYALYNACCLVIPEDYTPENVLACIARYDVELLPITPSFANLIILSEAYRRYNLKSLKTLSYGTEPMPCVVLKRLQEIFSNTRIIQLYGLSETGILRSKPRTAGSLWLKLGNKEEQVRIVDGILQIKSPNTFIGYLNAPSPFTLDGWFDTGDLVEQEGEYIKIIGRKSDIINVGGLKVYPAEVENLISKFENVADVIVYGEKNPILGNIVCADVCLKDVEEEKAFIKKLKIFCNQKLQSYKVPVKVKIVNKSLYTARFKKARRTEQLI
ncbi:fatty acid--CoA ligase family protein [Candidatus Riflebacteria bacterium]